MKTLLTITAIFEGITGLSLIIIPTIFVAVLLGIPPTESIGILVCRLTGIALLSLAIICWSYRKEMEVTGIIKALLFYNIAASALLVYASMTGFTGLGIWPATLIHAGMAVWCVKSIENRPARK
ncbi:MAG: hypothetical protein ABL895_09115 [Cyclobacteriaceae bacterium]